MFDSFYSAVVTWNNWIMYDYCCSAVVTWNEWIMYDNCYSAVVTYSNCIEREIQRDYIVLLRHLYTCVWP